MAKCFFTLLHMSSLILALMLHAVSAYADVLIEKSIERNIDVTSSPAYALTSTVISPDTLQTLEDSDGLAVDHRTEISASTGDFSMSFWFRPEQNFDGQWRIMSFKGSEANERNFSIWMRPNDNRLHFRVSTDSNFNEGGDSKTALAVGQWYHIAYVKENNQLKLYINGRLDSTVALAGTVLVNQGPFYLGDTPWHSPALGQFSAVNIYQRKVTSLGARAMYLEKFDEFDLEEQGVKQGTPFAVQGPIADSAGLQFDSEDDGVVLPNSINVRPGTTNFGLAFWVKLEAAASPEETSLVFKGASATDYNFAISRIPNTNRISYRFKTDTTPEGGRQSVASLPLNEWTHLAYVKNGSRLQLFIDGTKDSEVNLDGNFVYNDAPMYLGKTPWLSAANISIDQVAMFNYQLVAADISRLMSTPASEQAKLGQWSDVIPWPQVPVSAASLPDGRVLTWSGSERTTWPSSEKNYSSTWDPKTNSFNELYSEGHNMFCAHLAMTEEGQVFVNGGRNQLNSPWTSLFNFENNEWTMVDNMATGGRWYPVTVALPSGEMMTSMGTASNFNNPEKWSASKGWEVLNSVNYSEMRTTRDGTSGARRWWANLSVAPSGDVFHFWSTEENHLINTSGTGAFQSANASSDSADVAPGVAIQYDAGKMLITGGNQGSWVPTARRNQAFTVDLNTPSPSIQVTNNMTIGRGFHNLVPLPNGDVMAVGGSRNSGSFNNVGSVFDGEIWNPQTGEWTRTAASSVPRNYHSVALLLNDGRVLSAGGGYGSGNEFLNGASHQNGQIFTPPYLFNADGSSATRPSIDVGPGVIRSGEAFTVTTSADVSKFSLLRMGSTTHAVNTDARFHWVDAQKNADGQFTLSAHENPNVLIPGYWMMFALNDAGVPSEAHVVKVVRDIPVTTPGDVRYVRLIAESETNNFPWTSAAEINVIDGNGDVIERRDWIASVDSANAGAGYGKALDGDPATHWHTDWSPAGNDNDPAHEHSFTIDMRVGYTATALTYLPRQDASFNGHIADYRVEVSADGVNWIQATRGTLPQTRDLQTLTFGSRPEVSGILVAEASAAQSPASFNAIAAAGLTYSWSFGDGSPATAFSTVSTGTHSYAEPGRYIVVLTVENPATGESTQFSSTKIVYDAAVDVDNPNRWLSSTSVAFHPTLAQVWNVNPDNATVSVTDTQSQSVIAEIDVEAQPSAIAFDDAGRAWVTNKQSASVSIIDANSFTTSATIELSNSAAKPHGIVIAGSSAYVALQGMAQVVKIDTTSLATISSADVLSNPQLLALSPSANEIYVGDFVVGSIGFEHTASPDASIGLDALAVLSTTDLSEVAPISLMYSDDEISENTGPGIPNYLSGIAMHPAGTEAYLASKQDNILGGTRRSGMPLTFDQTVRAVSSRIETQLRSEDVVSRIDHDNASVATAAVYGPYGIHLFTALEGNRQIAISTPSTDSEIARFDVGRAPQGLALSPDGRTLVSHNFMDRSVSFIDIANVVEYGALNPEPAIDVAVVQTETLEPEILNGKQLFYDAQDDRLAALDYMSCASCHADGGQDGRVWDFSQFGEGLRNTISLNGKGGMAHGLLHWSANFDELQDFEGQIRGFAGGTGLMNDVDFYTADRADSMGLEKAGLSPDLDALAAYMTSLSKTEVHPISVAEVTPEARIGESLFNDKGCSTCHSGATFTDSLSAQRHDVGTLLETSGQRLGAALDGLDTPTVLGLLTSAPYLHDGSAATIEDAISAHTIVNLSEEELVNLTAYLYQAPLPPIEPNSVKWQSGRVDVLQTDSDTWHSTTFSVPFAVTPVVVGGAITFEGGQPVTLRVRNVSSKGFEFQVDEWEYLDGYHVTETIQYLAMEPGVHDIGGLKVEAFTASVNQSWKTLNFDQSFSSAPAVFAQIASVNEADAATTRVRNIGVNSVQVQLEEQESNAQQHVAEDVHVIAIEAGSTLLNGQTVSVGKTGRSVKHNWVTVDHGETVGSYTLIAGMQSAYGGDTSTTRIRNMNATSFDVHVDEEQSRESEVAHTTEVIGWILISD